MNVRTLLPVSPRTLIISGLLAITLFSGQFSAASLWPWLPDFATQFRLWGTALLVLVAAWQWRKDRPCMGESAWTIIPLTLFGVYMVARSLPYLPGEAASRYGLQVALLMAQAASIWVLCQERRMINALLWWAVLLAVFLFFLGLTGIGRLEIINRGWAPLSTSTTLYRLAALGIAAAVALGVERTRNRRNWIGWLFVIAAFTYTAFASLARIAPIALAGMLVWIGLGLAAKRRYLAMGAVTVAVAIGTTIFTIRHADIMIFRYGALAAVESGAAVEESEKNQGVVGRIELYRTAFHLFLEHPVVGAGPAGFNVPRRLSLKGDSTAYTYPHNVMLEALAVGGGIGGALMLLAILVPLVPALRHGALNDSALALGGYLPFALVASMVSGDVYDFRLYWVVSLLVPLIGTKPVKETRL